MQALFQFLKKYPLQSVLFLGFSVRIIFYLFFAQYYYGTPHFYYAADTGTWCNCFYNWYKTGHFTGAPGTENGYFGRMPGYSFFIGFFYIITNYNWITALKLIVFVQIFLDVLNIYLVYKIAEFTFQQKRIAILSACIYALYPFAIVWNVIAYSELLSLHFVFLTAYFLFKSNTIKHFAFSSICLGIAILIRPQIAVLLAVLPLVVLLNGNIIFMNKIKYAFVFFICITLTYGLWPIRNYVNHGKVVLTQDLTGFNSWTADVSNFTSFIYACQVDWEPQFTQIIKNKEVEFPKYFSLPKQDSILLQKTFYQCKMYSPGFSNWVGYWQQPQNNNDYIDTIGNAFKYLRQQQIEHNKFLFYVKLPLLNLKKAIFKSGLYDAKTTTRKIASSLFLFRTLFILVQYLCTNKQTQDC
jgi:hypothetical protein